MELPDDRVLHAKSLSACEFPALWACGSAFPDGRRLRAVIFVIQNRKVCMLTLTQTAGARLSELLDGSPEKSVVRIVRRKGRLKLRLDHERTGDVTFAHDGRTVLTLNERISRELSLRTLDVRAKNTGPRLSLKSSS